jgi:type IV secretory pathway VirB10-like protein
MEQVPQQPQPVPPRQGGGLGAVPHADKLKKWGVIGCIGVLTVVGMKSVPHTNDAANQLSRKTNQALTKTGPQLSDPKQIQAQELALEQQMQQLAAQQNQVKAQQQMIMGSRNLPPGYSGYPSGYPNEQAQIAALNQQLGPANNGAATGGNSGASSPSPLAQIRQQIAQDRMKEEYASLFADPVASRREQKEEKTTAASEPKQADENRDEQETEPKSEQSEQRETSKKKTFAYDVAQGPYHVIPRNTVVDGVLLTPLDGSVMSTVMVQSTSPVYVPRTKIVLIPEGSYFYGTAKQVQVADQKRLAVSFDRVDCPDNYAISLDDPSIALAQGGETGLASKVNNHYLSTFGFSLAIGAVAGLSQIGNGLSGYGYDPGVSIRAGIGQSVGQEATQVMSKLMNRLPSISVKAGTRTKIIFADDLPHVPEYERHQMIPGRM